MVDNPKNGTLGQHFSFADSDDNPTCFDLYWYGEKIGSFSYGGAKDWQAEPGYEDLFIMDDEGRLPCFLDNINPEGWLKEALDVEMQTEYIARGLRFLSNFVINKQGENTNNVIVDSLYQNLEPYKREDGVFTGQYEAHMGLAGEDGHDEAMKDNWADRHMPRLSGAEQKLFMTLYPCGTMQPAQRERFTHFAKYPDAAGGEALGLNEFIGMKMSEAAGLNVPEYALIDQGEHPPVFCVERFDVPHEDEIEGAPKILMQDFCTLLQQKSHEKGCGSVEKVFKKMRELSNQYNPEDTQDNLHAVFDRVVAAWIMNDGDLHLKNMSVLFDVDPQSNQITGAHFSPVYDPTTDLFSMQGGTTSALMMAGSTKANRNIKAFVNLAKQQKLFLDDNGKFDQQAAENHIRDMASKMAATAVDFAQNPPQLEAMNDMLRSDMNILATNVVDRARVLGAQTPEWDSKAVWDNFKTTSPKNRRMEAEGRIVDGRKITARRANARQGY